MWRPLDDLEPFNRLIIKLEQAFLAVLRKKKSVEELASSSDLSALWAEIDAHPLQAAALARIKSGHTMTPRHGINVMMLVRAWAIHSHKLGTRLNDLALAALVHDVGHWRPDDLVYIFEWFSHEELRRMRGHTVAALDELNLSEEARGWIAQHHEQPDGRGYPKGITDPHPLAQLLRICDCYDGLTSPRRFRPAYTAHKAMVMMRRWSGYKYDAGLFESFWRFIGGDFPYGSFVRMASGAVAMTLPSEDASGQLMILTNTEGDRLDDPLFVSAAEGKIGGEAYQWHQVELPDEWRNLRPDLLNLPRFYN